MTCARQVVTATLVTTDGRRFIGRNDVANPQVTCPRGDMPTGQGYELCASVCRQGSHAEVAAIRASGETDAKGATIYLEGHTYACAACLARAAQVGATIIIGPPPALTTL